MAGPPPAVLYDAGALVAAERNDEQFRSIHQRFVEQKRTLVVPAPVLTQVWRASPRQARLSWALRSCTVEPTTEAIARYAGLLLGRSGLSDAVDAIVVATAHRRGAVIVTSDPDDIGTLWNAAETTTQVPLIVL